jgi:hypothetical protein
VTDAKERAFASTRAGRSAYPEEVVETLDKDGPPELPIRLEMELRNIKIQTELLSSWWSSSHPSLIHGFQQADFS